MHGTVAAYTFGPEGAKLLLDGRCLQLNGSIRVTTIDFELAETEFSVVRFECDVAGPSRFTQAPILSPPKTLQRR
jgi:hypothetical protein